MVNLFIYYVNFSNTPPFCGGFPFSPSLYVNSFETMVGTWSVVLLLLFARAPVRVPGVPGMGTPVGAPGPVSTARRSRMCWARDPDGPL